jgi:NAD(P)-dependent dehydrogenase (short-subunit alcohol dehydrogenase family)
MAKDLPDLSGKRIIVTGGNSGIGFHAAAEFAKKGASVVLACRSIDKGRAAAAQITSGHSRAEVELIELDLARLESVRNFARIFQAKHQNLHVLCNNAGVMALPYRRTADGLKCSSVQIILVILRLRVFCCRCCYTPMSRGS